MDSYCWPQSVLEGGSCDVSLHISSTSARCNVSVLISGSSEVQSHLDVPCSSFPTPAEAYSKGCQWPSALSIPTAGLRSAIYIVKVEAPDGSAVSYAYFVITSVHNKAPILMHLSTATWNAYNDWGGRCLYTGSTSVSFERPLANGFLHKSHLQCRKKAQPLPGDKEAVYYTNWAREQNLSVWSGSSGWWNWERLVYEWLVGNGFEVDVATSVDLHSNPALLDGHRVFLSVGHDEYWSAAMRDHVEAFRARGGGVCVLSGNTCFWQVRFENEDKAMVCYKYTPEEDPVLGTALEHTLSTQWVDRRIGRPEQSTIGLSFSRGGYSRYGNGVPRASGGYTVYRPEHWVFAGTNVCYGDVIGVPDCVVAYEVDGCDLTMVHGVPKPTFTDGTPAGLTILAMAPARLWSQYEQPSRYCDLPGELEAIVQAMYGDSWRDHLHEHANNHCVIGLVEPSEQAGMLFNVGVTDWAYGLEGRDPDIESITRNVLNRMLSR